MTYSEFITAVRRNAFPEGEARNLKNQHTDLILDAVIDLQRWVPRLRRRQFTLHHFQNTLYKCAATYIDRPPGGQVIRVYTYINESQCDAVYYQGVDRKTFDRTLKERYHCGSEIHEPDLDDNSVYSDETMGFTMASADNDKGWRAASGIYTIIDDQIMMYPHIESCEYIGVEWRGLKYEFDNDDIVDWNRDVQHAAELWLRWKDAARNTCDERDYLTMEREFNRIRADMIIDDRTQERVSDEEVPYECCSPYQLAAKDDCDTEATDTEADEGDLCTRLLEWAMSHAYEEISQTYDDLNRRLTSTVRWKDGSMGTWTMTLANDLWLTWDAYTITHDDSGAIVTQAPVTRDDRGNITYKPPLTVSGCVFTEGDGLLSTVMPEKYDTCADLQAATAVADIVAVIQDGNGSSGFFFRDEDSTAADDCVNTIIDAVGVHYTRFSPV